MLKTTADQFKNIKKKTSTNTATNIFSVEINVEELPNDWYLFRSEALVLNGSGGCRRILLLHNLLEFNPITDIKNKE